MSDFICGTLYFFHNYSIVLCHPSVTYSWMWLLEFGKFVDSCDVHSGYLKIWDSW